jgi:hypothetical protein
MTRLRVQALAAAMAAGLSLPVPAAAQQQQNPNSLFTGTIIDSGPGGYDEFTKVTCRGYPTCTGSFSAHARQAGCSNYLDFSGAFNVSGLNLARSGSLQGVITTQTYDTIRLANGTCQLATQAINETLPYTGSWNLETRTGTLRIAVSFEDTFNIDFTADVNATAPVFPMTVNARIAPDFSTVTANIQFRPQDVGRNGSVFVFASAPANRVVGGLALKAMHLGYARVGPKADPVPCVLAQMSPAGQLVAVSASQLQAFVTGAFTAAGQAVSILNNTPTPGIAGATFYVGYGANGSGMLNDGIFRNAALIPGDSVCPMLPYMTALWWNPDESGWGLNLNHQGNVAFATLFTYDASRAPLWLVMSAGALQPDGLTFTGDLYRTTGPAFNANPFTPIGAANVTNVGRMSISFSEANAAVLTYTVNGVEVQKPIQRQVYGSRASACLPTVASRASSTNYQDLWWNPAESGWGLNVTHQDNTFFATLFTYDNTGRGLWLVMPSGTRQADGSYLGDLYRTAGPVFNAAPFTPIAGADITLVGNMRLRFTDGNNGTLSYSYNGTNVTKAITRQLFSTPQSACN